MAATIPILLATASKVEGYINLGAEIATAYALIQAAGFLVGLIWWTVSRGWKLRPDDHPWK